MSGSVLTCGNKDLRLCIRCMGVRCEGKQAYFINLMSFSLFLSLHFTLLCHLGILSNSFTQRSFSVCVIPTGTC